MLQALADFSRLRNGPVATSILHSYYMTINFIQEYPVRDKTLCDDLIDLFNAHPERHVVGGAGTTVDASVKESTEIALSPGLDDTLMGRYIGHIRACTEKYMKTYEHAAAQLAIVDFPKLQMYQPGEGFYKYHWESSRFTARHRALAFMTYLNDVTDGGGTDFLYQEVTTKARKGTTLIWPCDFTHTHRGEVSETQQKYITTGWLSWTPQSA